MRIRGFRIVKDFLVDDLNALLKESGVEVGYDARFSHVIREGCFQVGEHIEFLCFAIICGSDGIHSTVRGYIHPSATPKHSGLMAINSIVPRAYRTAITSLRQSWPNPGAFLPVPQEVKGSKLLASSQRRLEGRDGEGPEQLRSDQRGLLDALEENKQDWPGTVQAVLQCRTWGIGSDGTDERGASVSGAAGKAAACGAIRNDKRKTLGRRRAGRDGCTSVSIGVGESDRGWPG